MAKRITKPRKHIRVEDCIHVKDDLYKYVSYQGGRKYPNSKRYWLRNCAACGTPTLQDKAGINSGKAAACSDTCRGNFRLPVGSVFNNGNRWYIKKPDHPKANCKGLVPYHRFVVEEHLGRLLTSEEHVHHIDCDDSNNEISNLWVANNCSEHIKAHGSLNRIVKSLLARNLIYFDKQEGIYKECL